MRHDLDGGAFHVQAKSPMTLEDARERGRRAFEAGTPCAPIHDSGFSVEACHAEAATSELMAEWHRGWTLANIDAPVEPSEPEFDERGLA